MKNRKIELEGSFNLRDLGGYTGFEGKTVKWGKLYRSDDLSQLTLEDVRRVESLHIKTIVDFRSEGERIKRANKQLHGVTTFHLSPNAPTLALASGSLQTDQKKVESLIEIAESNQGEKYFFDHLDSMAVQMIELVKDSYANEQYRKMFKLLMEEENSPFLQHCRGGKDRTGFGTALILFALGVNEEQVLEDYMLTGFYMKKRNEKRLSEYAQFTSNKMVLDYLYALMDTRRHYMEAAIHEMKSMGGSIEGYLNSVMLLNEEDLEKIRRLYLEEPQN